jgi:hypothetical protein
MWGGGGGGGERELSSIFTWLAPFSREKIILETKRISFRYSTLVFQESHTCQYLYLFI